MYNNNEELKDILNQQGRKSFEAALKERGWRTLCTELEYVVGQRLNHYDYLIAAVKNHQGKKPVKFPHKELSKCATDRLQLSAYAAERLEQAVRVFGPKEFVRAAEWVKKEQCKKYLDVKLLEIMTAVPITEIKTLLARGETSRPKIIGLPPSMLSDSNVQGNLQEVIDIYGNEFLYERLETLLPEIIDKKILSEMHGAQTFLDQVRGFENVRKAAKVLLQTQEAGR